MPGFQGFPAGSNRMIAIPDQFFRELLPQIDDLDELRLVLYFFWRLEQMEGNFRYLRLEDFYADPAWMDSLDPDFSRAAQALVTALERAVGRGVALAVPDGDPETPGVVYFLNTARGRAAAEAAARGEWRPAANPAAAAGLRPEPLNVYRLYEENIGPLTPMIADALRDAEQVFPADWLEDAFRIAVEKNARNWRYILAILNRWQKDGRDERKNRHDTEKDRRRYVEGEFSDFIEH